MNETEVKPLACPLCDGVPYAFRTIGHRDGEHEVVHNCITGVVSEMGTDVPWTSVNQAYFEWNKMVVFILEDEKKVREEGA